MSEDVAGPEGDTPSSQLMLPTEALDRDQREMLYSKLGLFERSYTIGLLNMGATLGVLMRWPEHFWILYMAKAIIFLPWRLVRFRRRNLEWYMMDFCYFVTYYCIIMVFIALMRTNGVFTTQLHEYNRLLLRVGFAFTNGAMVWAIPLYGNKLVFHDIDNTTSVFIHLSPALFLWCLRWGGGLGTSRTEEAWPGMFHVCDDMKEADIATSNVWQALWYTGPCAAQFTEFVVWPPVLWICLWGLPYYLIMFCCLKGYLAANDKEFLYSWTVKQKTGQGALLAKLPEALRPLGFMLMHFAFTSVFGFASMVSWNSYVIHTLMLVVIFFFAIHNGSTFMFRVVAARHVQGLVRTASTTPKVADYKPVPLQ